MAKALNKPSFIIFSPWIEKKMWATFEDGKNHCSVHLKDFEPALFDNKTEKELKKEAENFYHKFTPKLIIPKLKAFSATHFG
jgi:heptosyltransferase-2